MHDHDSASERDAGSKITHGHVPGNITDHAAEDTAAKTLMALVFAGNPGAR